MRTYARQKQMEEREIDQEVTARLTQFRVPNDDQCAAFLRREFENSQQNDWTPDKLDKCYVCVMRSNYRAI